MADIFFSQLSALFYFSWAVESSCTVPVVSYECVPYWAVAILLWKKTHLNLSLHPCPCPDDGILWLVPSASAHCIAQGAAVRSWRQRMLFLVLHFKCEPFFLFPKLCLLSDHVSKRQWISAFKTLPQKVVGFFDKEEGRKNLFYFKSPCQIMLLPSHVAAI